MKNIKRTFAALFLATFGSLLLINCEPDVDSLGEQLFLNDLTKGVETSYDIIGFNIDNKDTIQSNAAKIDSGAVIGAFAENQFGMQKAAYLTQLRLSTYDPDFGKNAQVDSVVLVVKPKYASDSVVSSSNDTFVYTNTDGNIDAKKVVKTYPVVKFGKTDTKLTLKVHEVLSFLNAASDVVSSGNTYSLNSQVLGSKDFYGKISSVSITKRSDESSSLFSSEAGIRIPLNANFFQNKIVNMQGKAELKDVANFIRYFRGLRISVEENDGYLMTIAPNDMSLIMYYKYDKTSDNVTTRPQTSFTFDLGTDNAHIGEYKYDRSGSAWASALGNINSTSGDKKLFAQGMGGPSIGVKIPAVTIDSLKHLYETKKAAIISAKIRLYTDASWSNEYYKPNKFTIIQHYLDADNSNKSTFAFTQDITKLTGATNFKVFTASDLSVNPSYYDFTVTQSVKDLVESDVNNTDRYFKIDLARFLLSSTGAYQGYQYTSRAYSTARAVFVGTDPTNVNRIQLKITYGTK